MTRVLIGLALLGILPALGRRRRVRGAVVKAREQLHLVQGPTNTTVRLPGETVAQAQDRTARLIAGHGARLELTVADADGVEIPVRMVEADLPAQLRLQAIAVFRDRADVVGQSDPIERCHYRLYEHSIEWLQAFAALRQKFAPTAVPTPDEVNP